MLKKIIFLIILIMANNNIDKAITSDEFDKNENDLDIYSNYLKGWEGFSGKAYKPVESEEHYTIGYGHYGSDVKPDDVMTEGAALGLLRDDINDRLPVIKGRIKNFDSLPIDLKKNIVSSWFRGSLSGSPKTIELINQGKYKEASEEFLNNEEYKNAAELGKPGIIKRMDATSKSLLDFGTTLENE